MRITKLSLCFFEQKQKVHLGCVWFPVKVGWEMTVHILLDMEIKFSVWWSEYGDPFFFFFVRMKVDLVIHFSVWLGE
jgi:hypothetical protein